MGILNYFTDSIKNFSDRKSLLKEFNQVANIAFVSGQMNHLLKATTTIGEYSYKHPMSSNVFISGFRVEIKADYSITDSEIIEMGDEFLTNKVMVRQLMALGYDTFILCIKNKGKQWKLSNYA